MGISSEVSSRNVKEKFKFASSTIIYCGQTTTNKDNRYQSNRK